MSAADGHTPDVTITIDTFAPRCWWNAHIEGDTYIVPEVALREYLQPRAQFGDFVEWVTRGIKRGRIRSQGERIHVTRANWELVKLHYGPMHVGD